MNNNKMATNNTINNNKEGKVMDNNLAKGVKVDLEKVRAYDVSRAGFVSDYKPETGLDRLTKWYDDNYANLRFFNSDKEILTSAIAVCGTHTMIAKSIIKKIASVPEGQAGFRGMKACLDIVNSGYTQAIYEDIESEIYIKCMELVKAGLMVWDRDNKRLVYGTITTKKGTEKSAYVEFYRVVSKVLYDNSKASSADIPIFDMIAMRDDGSSVSISRDNANYRIMASEGVDISDVIIRNDIQSFLEYCKGVLTDKMYARLYKVFCYMVEGFKQVEIADILEVSIDTINKDVSKMRGLYNEWKEGAGIRIVKRDNDNKSYMRTQAGYMGGYRILKAGYNYIYSAHIKPDKKDYTFKPSSDYCGCLTSTKADTKASKETKEDIITNIIRIPIHGKQGAYISIEI